MKHVWIVNHYAGRPTDPGGTRHYSLAQALTQFGWETTILAATTEHRSGAQRDDLPATPDGVADDPPFRWLRAPTYRGNGPSRILNMGAFTFRALSPAGTRGLRRPDVVIGSSVHPLAAWAGSKLARRHGCPFVYEIRDLWPETLVRIGRMDSKSLSARALYRLEANCWAGSAFVLSPLGAVDAYGKARGLPHRTFVHIPNGVDVDRFTSSPATTDRIRLMYLGFMGETDYLDVLIEAMSDHKVRSHSARPTLDLYGDGPARRQLERMVAERGLSDTIRFRGLVPSKDIPNIAARATAFVLPLADNDGLYTFGASPNKIHDYLAAGRPTLLNAPFVDDPVSRWSAGIRVPECTPESWAQSIANFCDLEDQARALMGRRAREAAEAEFGFDQLAQRLSSAMDRVVSL